MYFRDTLLCLPPLDNFLCFSHLILLSLETQFACNNIKNNASASFIMLTLKITPEFFDTLLQADFSQVSSPTRLQKSRRTFPLGLLNMDYNYVAIIKYDFL